MEMTTANGQFLGMAGISALVFIALSVGAVIASFIAAVSGTAGGLALLAFMAFVFPPALLIPIHTVVQLGAAASLGISRRKYMMWETALPFLIGTTVGAVAGGQIFVNLPESVLLMTLAISILVLVWVPKIARFGPERGRFLFVGFIVTFLGVFISATGTLLATFTAAIAPDRRNHIAMVGILMSVVHIAKLTAFGLLGVSFGSYVPLIISMIAASFLGTWIGKGAMDRIPERAFRLGFQVILTAMALRLIWIAISDL